jgi:hypothetical protein
MNDSIQSRISGNKHFASLLRRRLESHQGEGAVRDALDQLTDAQLVTAYLANEQQGREHRAKTRVQNLLSRAEKEADV